MHAKMSWIAVLAAVAVLIPQPGYAQSDTDTDTAAEEYSIFYLSPARVDALFAAFLKATPNTMDKLRGEKAAQAE